MDQKPGGIKENSAEPEIEALGIKHSLVRLIFMILMGPISSFGSRIRREQ